MGERKRLEGEKTGRGGWLEGWRERKRQEGEVKRRAGEDLL